MREDAKCLRCGRCCYEKVLFNGRVFNTGRPCKHLDVETKLCRVYERRHEVNPHCLSVEEGTKLGVFPADCPYVAGLAGYVPPMDEPPAPTADRNPAEAFAEWLGAEER
jgi:uncharacterized cysteine cluster protein YcgN (CxxCxxCC family)